MNSPSPQTEKVFNVIQRLKKTGIAHLIAEDVLYEGNTVQIQGEELTNFSSCSYLGLETDTRLKEAAHEVIDRYGVHFSSSRAYLSIQPYEELEYLMGKIFGSPTLVMPSTTMAHLSALPLLVGKNDAVILDHQVHASVQLATKIVKEDGTYVEWIRHNSLDYLENRIQKLSLQYNKIWYMADGVYSMYGDCAPIKELHQLMNKYGKFHLYLDDAHGMSWIGRNGAGYALSQAPLHPKMILTTSLGKGFGTSGGAIICNNEETRTLIKNCGGTFIFSGPLQPANLGAAIASARIHLSDEIYFLQDEIKERMDFFHERLEGFGLPVVSNGKTPIFFIGVGKQEAGFRMIKGIKDAGFFTNIAVYPSVPENNTGIRIIVNRHHTFADLTNLSDTIASLLPEILYQEQHPMEAIYRAFKLQDRAKVFAAAC